MSGGEPSSIKRWSPGAAVSPHSYAKQRSRGAHPARALSLFLCRKIFYRGWLHCTVRCTASGVRASLRMLLARKHRNGPAKPDRRRAHWPCLPVYRHPRHRQNHLRQNFCQSGQLPGYHQPDPCGECAVCKGIDEGTILDVSEIDAASNNSVDDIRDLRDETAYLPAVCKYKVYIIDEVHMLSTSAFNALLKTMEEPPEHVIFILATTEVQKVPATILSRCQRYDFQRITADKIAGRLEYVAGQENIELDHNAAELIGRLADGAMRDALSILDTCAGVSNTVDEALVRRMAGVTDRKYLFEISDAIAARDAVKALQEIAALRQQSVDMRRLCMELDRALPQFDAQRPARRHRPC